MAELNAAHRQEWLASLALRIAAVDSRGRPSLEAELREVARGCRVDLAAGIERQLGPFDPLQLRALLEVPRERFVRAADVARSADDTPLPLDDDGNATISAPHAYLLSYRLVALAPGDSLLELGTGSGYGAALAAFIVGGDGSVVSIEIDPALYAWASAALADHENVRVRLGDAVEIADAGRGARKIVVTFAVRAVPGAWLAMIPEGGVLVAPVGPRDHDQRLVRVAREDGRLVVTDHGAVRYVNNRSSLG